MLHSPSNIKHIVKNIKLEYEDCSLEDIIKARNINLIYLDDFEAKGAYGKFDFKFENGFVISRQFIFINSNLNYHEIKAILAHELGHALLHPDINTIDERYKPIIPDGKIERQADIFASEFLLDDDSTIEYVNSSISNVDQARYQYVPVKYVDLKCENLSKFKFTSSL